jgi:hypothetical protein
VTRRKGELSPAQIDRGWPHQVALPSSQVVREFGAIEAFCRDLSRAPRGHSVVHENQWFNVYCFADPDHAQRFMARFGGERFKPEERGRGASWARWNKK